jgi:hypothetical protein
MPIISKSKSTLEKLKGIKIDSKTLAEVKSYCEHFGVSLEEFANQAFQYILDKDKDWKNKKENQKENVPK